MRVDITSAVGLHYSTDHVNDQWRSAVEPTLKIQHRSLRWHPRRALKAKERETRRWVDKLPCVNLSLQDWRSDLDTCPELLALVVGVQSAVRVRTHQHSTPISDVHRPQYGS